MSIRVKENILEIKPYVPGKPIEELERELGIAQSIKLASNENPLGASPMALAALRDAIGNLHRYPSGTWRTIWIVRRARLSWATDPTILSPCWRTPCCVRASAR